MRVMSGIYNGVSLKLRGKKALLQTVNRGHLYTDDRCVWVRAQFDDMSLTGSGPNGWGHHWHVLPRAAFIELEGWE